jgi:mono/diheme cytochrome c family protein
MGKQLSPLKWTLGFLVLLSGCSFRVEKSTGAGGDPSAIMPTQQQLDGSSFAAVYAAVLQPHCISCHGTSGGVNLESYSAALSALGQIKSVAIDSRQMPKSPEAPLSTSELQILNAWILTNGREFPVDGTPPPPPPPPLVATYTSIKAHIFDAKCISCHKVGGKAQKYPFTSLAEIINNPDPVVISGSVAQSALNDVLQPGADTPMPPGSSGYSPLSNDEITVIQEWITNGLPE